MYPILGFSKISELLDIALGMFLFVLICIFLHLLVGNSPFKLCLKLLNSEKIPIRFVLYGLANKNSSYRS
ncbi:hypothetical protein LEP1GSC062_4304 [Leptospira alexanderi serovar Manhao 3 str. L 60]|uniref:Uncharacterized protein n=1 Tax=Leptospira alexanderi serovar Manhao 3 str. L 60 TaxID=1049759 RepID=V6HWP6_9LEPT|nr:hypothetical protein LEP1GSC062_4304 [Leptospira alexanderi serovar Manhao 3 str. L 60]